MAEKFSMFGLGGGGGGHAVLYGRNFRTFYCFHTNDWNNRTLVLLESDRWGPGLGGGGTASMFVATSLQTRYDLLWLKTSGWGGEFAIGGKWTDLAKVFTKNKKLIKMVGEFGKHIDEMKKASEDFVSQLQEWAEIGVDALGLDRNAKTPQWNHWDLPGAGGGLEVSAYYEWLEITSITPENLLPTPTIKRTNTKQEFKHYSQQSWNQNLPRGYSMMD